MANRTIKDSQLTEGAIILVRGNIEYCRLIKRIEGEELVIDQRRKAQLGMNPVDKPYTTVQLSNARIVPLTPGQKTVDECFVEERFYKRNDDPADAPLHFSINNKSPFPNLFYQAVEGKTTEGNQIEPEAELANGLDVILVLRVFKPKTFNRKGITLHSVILQEPIRYYVGTNNKALEAAGIILHNNPAPSVTSAPATGSAAAAQPTAAPVSAPAPGTAFSTAAQAAPAMPEPEGPWTCPNCGNLVGAGQMFCGSCGTKKDAAAPQPIGGGNPYAAAAQRAAAANQRASGIRYDANESNRDY